MRYAKLATIALLTMMLVAGVGCRLSILKPEFECLSTQQWQLTEVTIYPGGDCPNMWGDIKCGRISFFDRYWRQYYVVISYGDIPVSLQGNESDINSLIRQSREAMLWFGEDQVTEIDAGSMYVGNYEAGYTKYLYNFKGYYHTDIVFVNGSTFVHIFIIDYADSPSEEAEQELTKTLNSITLVPYAPPLNITTIVSISIAALILLIFVLSVVYRRRIRTRPSPQPPDELCEE